VKRRVIIESPYAGDVDANLIYARECLRDSLKRGEAPLASHALYTQEGVLNDDDPDERKLGIEAGFAWRGFADATVVYLDRGMSEGMIAGINDSKEIGVPVETRSIRREVIAPAWLQPEPPKPTALARLWAALTKGKDNGRK
jgi:hypothetical protein